MYICINVYMHVRIYVYMYICMVYACMYTCVYVYMYICPPPCLWHVKRVGRTAGAGFRNFLLDLHPPAGNPSGIPGESVRESDRFSEELTESQFFQRSRYPGNLENVAHLKRNRLFDHRCL